MKINDFMVSYNMVQAPNFESSQEYDTNDPIDNFIRAQEFSNARQPSQPTETTQQNNNNNSYDWNAGMVGVKPEQQQQSNVPASKNDIVKFFRNKGLSEAQARGIYGNIMQESAGKLNAVSRDGHSSYGLAQWTGTRRARLHSKYGMNPTLNQQLEYLWEELNSSEKRALDDLRKQTSVEGATKSFMNNFERPHKDYANLNRRVKYAMQG